MLRDCIEKRDYWTKMVLELQGKEDDYPHQLAEREGNLKSWSQRVKTLEYVLGLEDFI